MSLLLSILLIISRPLRFFLWTLIRAMIPRLGKFTLDMVGKVKKNKQTEKWCIKYFCFQDKSKLVDEEGVERRMWLIEETSLQPSVDDEKRHCCSTLLPAHCRPYGCRYSLTSSLFSSLEWMLQHWTHTQRHTQSIHWRGFGHPVHPSLFNTGTQDGKTNVAWTQHAQTHARTELGVDLGVLFFHSASQEDPSVHPARENTLSSTYRLKSSLPCL